MEETVTGGYREIIVSVAAAAVCDCGCTHVRLRIVALQMKKMMVVGCASLARVFTQAENFSTRFGWVNCCFWCLKSNSLSSSFSAMFLGISDRIFLTIVLVITFSLATIIALVFYVVYRRKTRPVSRSTLNVMHTPMCMHVRSWWLTMESSVPIWSI